MNKGGAVTYAIMVRPEGADVNAEVEICRVKSNPEAIVDFLLEKTRVVKDRGKRKIVHLYEHASFKEIR
jgi:hypothetical protein